MSVKQNLLFVVHRVPFPPDRGDRIRSYHLLKFLASRANVWLASLADEALHPDCLSELQRHCQGVQIESLSNARRYLRGALSLASGHSATEGLFYSPALRRGISRWCKQIQFDAAIGFCSSVAPYLNVPELDKVPKFVDLVDVDSEKFFEYAARASGVKSFLYSLEAQRVRKLETRLGSECRGITFVTEPEASIYRKFAPTAHVRSAANGIDMQYFQANERSHLQRQNETPTCLFVGALDYAPNIDGIEWFCKHVWSEVLKRTPHGKLLIVGRNPTIEVNNLAKLPGVQVLANVPDVRPYYRQASVAIAPLRIARGLQNKVLEAFAMKTPVLSTPNAVEGIQVNGEHAMVATDAADWVLALEELFQNPSARDAYSSAGFQFVEAHHCWTRCLQPFAELLKI